MTVGLSSKSWLHWDRTSFNPIAGASGLDGVPLLPHPPPLPHAPPYTTAISTTLLATPPHTAWLIATGALTNIAHLFRAHPDLRSHIAGLGIMGGAIGNGFTSAPLGRKKGEGERFGNWTPYAEFNIYCDPEAAAGIFEDEVLAPKTVMVPLDVTHQAIADWEVRRGLLHGLSNDPSVAGAGYSPLRALFHDILTFFGETYDREFGLSAGPPLHDPLAVAAAVLPALFDDRGGERYRVEVDTRAWEDARGAAGRRTAGVRIPRTFDVPKFWWMIEGALGRAEGTTPLRREDVRGWAPRGG
ncbi:Uridine nucleosidase 1 [Coniosporium tulheliwenetii]|uniref:Uridine nucleosidase 1 n=1 Tax=Coniosporium tulheliwenetii TaxID=3383036 RepID=A0ACC2YPH7_9PEZI|nr:Uridine nucleosidase 1 [Cladosporium sp. JES 115]